MRVWLGGVELGVYRAATITYPMCNNNIPHVVWCANTELGLWFEFKVSTVGIWVVGKGCGQVHSTHELGTR